MVADPKNLDGSRHKISQKDTQKFTNTKGYKYNIRNN